MASLVVRRLTDNEEVDRVHLTRTDKCHVERVMSGMLMNMNTDDYFIDDSEIE